VPSFAVQSYFCTYVGTTKPVTLPVTRKHGPSTIFMSPIKCKPYGYSILLITPSNLSSKVAKNDKNDVFSDFFQNDFCRHFYRFLASANKVSYS
jgi:hypothetical protein